MKMQNNQDIFDEMENQNDEIKSEKMEVEIKSKINNLYNNNKFLKTFLLILSIIFLGLSIYNLYLNFNKTDDIDYNYLVISSSILVAISLFLLLTFLFKNKLESFFKTALVLSLIGFIGFNILVNNNMIKLEKQKLMINLVGMTYQDAKKWADENNVTIETNYEYSDIYDEYTIINQNVSTETLLKKIKSISIVISSGPNYDKSVVISNMNGWNIDDALEIINKNFLNNVEIQYIKNDDYDKDIIINQNIKGNMRRNDKLVLTVSLGNIPNKIEMIDIKDKSLFDLELWLKRNGINYSKEYEYNDQIKRNGVISVNKKQGEEINIENDKIVILISKGKAIKVPNILEMNIDDVTKWIIDNNLKIDYEDKYDSSVALGSIIDCNYKENDEIEEETTVKVVTSKGPLKMESFATLNDFRSWAEKYNIKYTEEYQYSDSISKGKIIKFSVEIGETIPNNQSTIVYISKGKSITIPNFVGKSKTEANKLCNNLGLNCKFIEGSYSNIPKDQVTSQDKKLGVTVVSGTSIKLTLSKGTAKSCTIYIQPTWLANSADGTISTLKNKLQTELKNKGCSDIKFDYKKICYNSYPSGIIGPDSPTKGGNNTFTDGKTYKIYISDTNQCQ